MEDIESEVAARRRGTGVKPLGVAAVLAQNPLRRPKWTKKSPAPAFHAASKAIRRELWDAYALFVAAYHAATEKLRAGSTMWRSRMGASRQRCRLWVGRLPAYLLSNLANADHLRRSIAEVKLERLRGRATSGLSTEEIMALTHQES